MAVFKSFCVFFLPAALVVVLVAGAIYYTNTQAELQLLKSHEVDMVALQKEAIADDFQLVISDLLFLSQQMELSEALEGDDPGDWMHLAMDYLVISSTKKVYDQICFIDADGMEKTRVNYNGGKPDLVAEGELQNKSHRYYFQDTFKLPRNEIYVSPFDLNIEHGKIEQPFKPMIRFGAPVFDFAGNKRGIVVLNYLGSKLIDHFIGTHIDHPNRSHLLNRDGYWLHGKSESEWSFMFPEREQESFSRNFPQAWQQISAADSGQFQTGKGLFTFAAVCPLPELNAYSPSYHWKIVSYVPTNEMVADDGNFAANTLQLAILMIFLLAAASWLLAKARAQHLLDERRMRRSEISLSEAQRVSRVGSWELDLVKDKLLWSDEIYRMFEINPKEFGASYEAFLAVIHPDDREKVNKAYLNSLEDKLPYDIEHRLLMKDGRVKWVNEHSRTFYNDEGEPIRSIGTVQDITKSIQAKNAMLEMNKKLEKQASTDPLTKVFNRRFFMQHASREFARFKRYGGKIAILFIDADNFKEINDKHGHAGGDKALISFVETLKAELRNVDVIGRTGGDEFAVLLPETGEHHAMEVAARICSRASSSLAFTVSIGVSTPSNETDSIETVINNADKAMYMAKDRGRNQVVNLGDPS
ncbi:diguanylate cyclase [Pseudomonadota bacterium]